MKQNYPQFIKTYSPEGKWVGVIKKEYLPLEEAKKQYPKYAEKLNKLCE